MKKHEKLMAGLLAGSLLLSLAGCGSTGGESSAAAGDAADPSSTTTESGEGNAAVPVTLTDEEVVFWGPWDGDVGDQPTAIIDSYNAETTPKKAPISRMYVRRIS